MFESLAFLHEQRVVIAGPGIAAGSGAGLGDGILEQQVIGYFFAGGNTLLWKIIPPVEQIEYGSDEFLLGDGFVGLRIPGERFQSCRDFFSKRFESLRIVDQCLPLSSGFYAFAEEILGEQLS